MSVRERVKSILIPLIHTSAALPTGMFPCTHTHTQCCKAPVRHSAVCYSAHQCAAWTSSVMIWQLYTRNVQSSVLHQRNEDSVRLRATSFNQIRLTACKSPLALWRLVCVCVRLAVMVVLAERVSLCTILADTSAVTVNIYVVHAGDIWEMCARGRVHKSV